MGMPSLRTFLDELAPDEILRVDEPLPLDYTPTALVMELEKRQEFPVLFLSQPSGSAMPVVANLFASRQRIARMAGVSAPADFNKAWLEAESNLVAPTIVPMGPAQEIVMQGEELDAGLLPISRHFAKDAGRYIGSGILVCRDPDTGVRNLSFQRLHLRGKNRFGASLHSRGHIWDHLMRAAARGQNLPVAVVIGCHPAIYLAAAAKVAMEIDEFDIAGALLKQPVELVQCKTIDVQVPADAEIVLEGELLADRHEDEGPYGEYTGYSTFRSTRNVFVVQAITRRTNPIYLDIIPGNSTEHLLLGRVAKEAHVFNRLKEVLPNIKALNYPKSGTHFHAYLSLRKTAEGQARQALLLLFGLDAYVKLGIVVDEDIDVFNEADVMWALATRFQADTNLFVVPKVFCNRLDPSSVDGMSAKLGLDATLPAQFEAERITLPAEAVEQANALLASR